MENQIRRNRPFILSTVNKSSFIGIGVTEILLGLSAIGCCIASLIDGMDLHRDCNYYTYYYCYSPQFTLTAQGIWAGSFTVIAGCINIDFGVNPSNKVASYSIGFTVFAALLNIAMVCLESLAVTEYYDYRWWLVNLHIVLLTLACLQVIFTFATFILSCVLLGSGGCCMHGQVQTTNASLPMTTAYTQRQGRINQGFVSQPPQANYTQQTSQMFEQQHQQEQINAGMLSMTDTNNSMSHSMQFPGFNEMNSPTYGRQTTFHQHREMTMPPGTMRNMNRRELTNANFNDNGNVILPPVRQRTTIGMPAISSVANDMDTPVARQVPLPGTVGDNPIGHPQLPPRQTTNMSISPPRNNNNAQPQPTRTTGNVAMEFPTNAQQTVVQPAMQTSADFQTPLDANFSETMENVIDPQGQQHSPLEF